MVSLSPPLCRGSLCTFDGGAARSGLDTASGASAWYERHGSAGDAIRHALVAEDFERAADLVERAIPEMRRSRQEAAVRGWLEALPDELIHVRPVLSAGYAWALLVSGELEGVEARLRNAEGWLDTTADMRERREAPSAETCPEQKGAAHKSQVLLGAFMELILVCSAIGIFPVLRKVNLRSL